MKPVIVPQEYKQDSGEVKTVFWSHCLAFCYWRGLDSEDRVQILGLETLHPVLPDMFIASSLDKKKRQQAHQVDGIYSNDGGDPVTYSVFAKVEHGIKVSCSFLS